MCNILNKSVASSIWLQFVFTHVQDVATRPFIEAAVCVRHLLH